MDIARLPKQARSRLTLHRLLSAAEALLDHGGLEAATVPAIARAAGVSVGVVYRRFPDKDMLLRAVYERAFQNIAQQNVSKLQQVATIDLPLPALVRGMVKGIAEGYRRKRNLLRALTRYARTHHDPEFRELARKMNRATLFSVVALLLRHRDEIRHPNPEVAIEFGLLAVSSVLHLLILEEEPSAGIRPPDQFEEELTRMFLAYLGVTE
ncbi:MAG TPA: TetR/AcrR family transcriptional regulator [Thermoanaerobaculia bacterium]|nr:TetR/AcrR family transcriptional regulator [Thermoanaerobaculia bacterium]